MATCISQARQRWLSAEMKSATGSHGNGIDKPWAGKLFIISQGTRSPSVPVWVGLDLFSYIWVRDKGYVLCRLLCLSWFNLVGCLPKLYDLSRLLRWISFLNVINLAWFLPSRLLSMKTFFGKTLHAYIGIICYLDWKRRTREDEDY